MYILESQTWYKKINQNKKFWKNYPPSPPLTIIPPGGVKVDVIAFYIKLIKSSYIQLEKILTPLETSCKPFLMLYRMSKNDIVTNILQF